LKGDRLFKWFGNYIVAPSIDAAWQGLQEQFVDEPDVKGGFHSMEEVAEHYYTDRQDLWPLYQSVNAREYLAAVDPCEYVELVEYELPSSHVRVSGTVTEGLEPPVFLARAEARVWAELLPTGFIYKADY